MKPIKLMRRIAALLLASALLTGASASAFAESSAQADEVRKLLEQYHISKPSESSLDEAAIKGMVDSLNDPYTEYFTQEEWSLFSSGLEQKFVGVGIRMVQENGAVYVEDVIAGSPAEQAGLRAGDKIVSVNGKSALNMEMAELQGQLLGEEGTSVSIGITRSTGSHVFTMVRKSIQLPTATGIWMGDGIGYLKLEGFTSDAYDKFAAELGKLERKGIKGLVIDLRDNGGGYIDQAKEIAGLFIQNGVLAHLIDRDGKDQSLTVQGQSKNYTVRILVNGNSASASELFAGALQDYGIAKLVGTRTYGKGVVQQLIPLSSGGVLKVTIEEYYTPNGRKVNGTGLTPDMAVAGTAEQLIAAYRSAGGKKLALAVGNGAVTVNNVRMGQPLAAVQRKGTWYVGTKLAAALVGASLRYDAASKTVWWTSGGTVHKVNVSDSRLLNENGSTYIDVRLLAKWYPGLTFSSGGGTLKLGYAGA